MEKRRYLSIDISVPLGNSLVYRRARLALPPPVAVDLGLPRVVLLAGDADSSPEPLVVRLLTRRSGAAAACCWRARVLRTATGESSLPLPPLPLPGPSSTAPCSGFCGVFSGGGFFAPVASADEV